jgi:hypothetical protein
MIGNGARAGIGAVLALASACGPASAQNKELSDKSVLTLMQYAWSLVPNKFTSPDGKVIEVDKSKPSEVVVPMDTAREAIKVARLSAYAQVCDLIEEQRANYHTFMKREEAKGKWSDQQLLFINQLHLFTVMTLTGKVKLVEKDGDKEVILNSDKPEKAPTCTDTEKKKVESQIKSYVAANVPPTPGTPAAPTTTATNPPPAAANPPPAAATPPPAAATQVKPASQKK